MYDFCVVGGGIVGLATARALEEQFTGASVAVVEKEGRVGAHQTGHNSGVVHSGLYYKPGSLKARLCVEGQRALEGFAADHQIPLTRSGKLVIATENSELEAMHELHRRGTENGLRDLRVLTSDEITEFEPHATGVAALHVPEAGVIDYTLVASAIADDLEGELHLGHPVTAIRATTDRVEIMTSAERVEASWMVNCAGLYSDRIAAMAGAETPVKIVPFRGEYYRMTPESDYLVKTLIYPVPDPRFPFLGVHFTRRADGSVEVGPNAVLALGREYYRGTRPNWGEVRDTLSYGGFHRLVGRYWRTGAAEAWRSMRRSTYARSAQALVPAVRAEHLEPGGAGVRAQAVTPEGKLVDDFSIVQSPRALHVLNAPSPGATASLAIGREVARMVAGLR